MLMRLLLDSRGELIYGELVDVPPDRPNGRFAAWTDLEPTVRGRVAERWRRDHPAGGVAK
jgi:hypothetical protein